MCFSLQGDVRKSHFWRAFERLTHKKNEHGLCIGKKKVSRHHLNALFSQYRLSRGLLPRLLLKHKSHTMLIYGAINSLSMEIKVHLQEELLSLSNPSRSYTFTFTRKTFVFGFASDIHRETINALVEDGVGALWVRLLSINTNKSSLWAAMYHLPAIMQFYMRFYYRLRQASRTAVCVFTFHTS